MTKGDPTSRPFIDTASTIFRCPLLALLSNCKQPTTIKHSQFQSVCSQKLQHWEDRDQNSLLLLDNRPVALVFGWRLFCALQLALSDARLLCRWLHGGYLVSFQGTSHRNSSYCSKFVQASVRSFWWSCNVESWFQLYNSTLTSLSLRDDEKTNAAGSSSSMFHRL